MPKTAEEQREANRRAQREYRLRHPDKVAARKRAYRAANLEKHRAWYRKHMQGFRLRNPDVGKKWKQKNEPAGSAQRSWQAMRQRCLNTNHASYHNYGGRGITICERWNEFDNFLADMGERPEGKTLDRIDTNGNYEPGNCRWATPKEQRNNRRIKEPA